MFNEGFGAMSPMTSDVTQADEAAAHEAVSAADITGRDGYYEIDIESVAHVIARHRIAHSTQPPPIDAGLVECVARAMCADGGFDPNEIMANDGPRWMYYESGATAAITALSAYRAERTEVMYWKPIESASDSSVMRLLYEPSAGDALNDPFIYIGGYTVRCTWEDDEGSLCHPTHWMPLPDAPIYQAMTKEAG
jgi:hypothetical protein